MINEDDSYYYDNDEYEEDNNSEDNEQEKSANYLGIMFKCCNTYGRIYKNRDKTAYVGHCPHCLRSIKIPIGKSGTNQRFFTAR